MKPLHAIVLTASLLSTLIMPVSAQSTEHLCYITVGNGRTIDLTAFCSGNSETVVKVQQSSLIVSNVKLERVWESGKRLAYITGTVTNNLAKDVQYTEIGWETYGLSEGKANKLESGNHIIPSGINIPSGNSANFRIRLKNLSPYAIKIAWVDTVDEGTQQLNLCFNQNSDDVCRRIVQ
ncbi:MAG TPA: hypothetical protein VE956_02130 [Nodularia sp. (in: cyanobacteria)]|nr:hypothetical protein [Nodularia sp. (in: cyanobacteria)]